MLTGAIIAACGAFWSAWEQGRSQEALAAKNDEIIQLNRQIAQSITGGDSFCYFDLPLNGRDHDNLLTGVVHKGEFPLYDLTIRILDLDLCEYWTTHGCGFFESMNRSQRVQKIGTLSPGTAQTIDLLDVSGRKALRLNVFCMARNGETTELIRMIKQDGEWVSALKVLREDSLLFERIGKGFPVDSTGAVNWD